MSARGLFWWGFAIALFLGLTWPITALYCSGVNPNTFRWIAHCATWGFFHIFILPIAAGLLLSSVDWKVVRMVDWTRSYRCLQWALLGVLAIVMVIIVSLDDNRNETGLMPLYMADPGKQIKAYEMESKLRSQDPRLKEDKDAYKDVIGAGPEKTKPTSNGVSRLSTVLNLLYGLGTVLVVWYLFVLGYTTIVQNPARQPLLDRMVLAIACIGLWFPCRVYATWYEEHIYRDHWLTGYNAFFVMAAVYLITGIVLGLLRFRDAALGAKVVSLGLFFTPVVTGVAGVVNPSRLEAFAEAVQWLSPVHFLAVGIVTMLLLGLVVCAVIPPLPSDEVVI
jgi:hypothetical protein